ncbi:MAG: hypothetical protein ACQCN6_06430 [Candidatus Bathyarchaeia archaeon]|jgi:hypothetical protein
MKDGKASFNILASIEKHIEALKPLLPKQAMVCIGEYPIKTFIKEPGVNKVGILPIFIEKSSDDIYQWIPRGYNPHYVWGFEDKNIDTHFWYEVLPTMIRDTSVMDSLKKKHTEELHSAIVFTSVWDGVGSAALPSLIGKFRRNSIDSLSLAILPSKIQPSDAHFNAYATLRMCLSTEGSTVVLLGRDQLESFDGVDRAGQQIKGNHVVNYLLNLFLSKDLLVQEIAELSRTFNVKLFSCLAVTAASYRVYGSLENMLDTALLKPLLDFDVSGSSLLYVLLRIPEDLREKIPRAKVELEITNWFKEKTSLQSIHISEPIYTDDLTDRIDAVLFIGGFDTAQMFAGLEKKVEGLKMQAVERGFMTEDWQLPFEVEEEVKPPEPPVIEETQLVEQPAQVLELQNIEVPVEEQISTEVSEILTETPAVAAQEPAEMNSAVPEPEVAPEQLSLQKKKNQRGHGEPKKLSHKNQKEPAEPGKLNKTPR